MRGVLVHRAAVPECHAEIARGIPVTSPARTVIDLARASFRDGVLTADAALRLGLCQRSDMGQVLGDCARWPGVSTARRVVAFANPKAESPLESIGRVVFAEYGLPAPQLQGMIPLGAGRVARVDFIWSSFATIAEADGMLKYESPGALRQEKLRQEALEQLGYVVVRFTWADIHTDPALVIARVRRAFARGEAGLRDRVINQPGVALSAGRTRHG
jgi:hypothetical protein